MPNFVHHSTYIHTIEFPLAPCAHAVTLEPSQERNEHLRVGAIVHGSLEVEGRVMHAPTDLPTCTAALSYPQWPFTGAILHSIRAVEERLLVALDRDEVWGLIQAENLVRRGTRAAAAHFLNLDRSCGVTMAAKHRNDRGLAV